MSLFPWVARLRKQKQEIPFSNLPAQLVPIREEILQAVTEVIDSSTCVLGPKVAEFEQAFARYVGVKHCVGVNSGTSALHLSLLAAGVGKGDEVITVPMTFVATCWAISYAGAVPVLVDIDPETWLMDVGAVRKLITPRTRALLPVHLYGQPVDMGPLVEISEEYGIPIIEDAAQAHGAAYRGSRVGTFGKCGCFSFYPGKNLGAYGEAGAIVTNDDQLADRLRCLRDHAQRQRYHHEELGFNYRMDAIQGAVLGVKLRHLEAWTQGRIDRAQRYQEQLQGLPIQLPVAMEDRRHVWHLFVTLLPERDRVRQSLTKNQVQTGLHYPIPIHLQQAYRDLGYSRGSFPVAERVAEQCLSLPLFPEMTEEQQDVVCASLVEAVWEVARK